MKKNQNLNWSRAISKPIGDTLQTIELIKKSIPNIVMVSGRGNRTPSFQNLLKPQVFIGQNLIGHPLVGDTYNLKEFKNYILQKPCPPLPK